MNGSGKHAGTGSPPQNAAPNCSAVTHDLAGNHFAIGTANRPAAAPRRRPRSIRTMLVWAVVGSVVPVWMVIAIGILSFYQHEREHIAQSTISIATALMAAVDRDIAGTVAALEMLADSEILRSDDFAAFHSRANKVVPQLGINIVLISSSGGQLVNTLVPYGEPLPLHGIVPQTTAVARNYAKVIDSGKPVVSDVFFGVMAKRPLVSVEVPVFRDNEVKYTLAAGIIPERFKELLIQQNLQPDWIVSIFDASGSVVARTPDSGRFVGQKGGPVLLAAIALAPSGVIETSTRDGIPVFDAFKRSAFSNWTVVIGIPVTQLSGELRKSLLLGGAGAFVFLSFGIALALHQSRQIVRSVQALIAPARALGCGEVPNVPRLPVREVDDVAQELDRAFCLLQNRTGERDRAQDEKLAADTSTRKIAEAYRRIEAVNKELEEFAYAASHDQKAPLRVIDNASKWLEEDLAEHLTGENRENMQLLRGRVGRMEKLLDDLLEYSRVGRVTDGRYVEIITGDVLIDNILTLLPPPEGFTVKAGPNFAGIRVCRMPLQQILMNLVSNAIKHHDKKSGCIEVTVEVRGTDYAFAVKDDGPGIPAQFHAQIFKMFQTLRPRDQVEGSGMGLAMVRKNIEVYGGTFKLDSAEGQGSTFSFTWPGQQQIRGENA
jgi:signal transduction histidine kinase